MNLRETWSQLAGTDGSGLIARRLSPEMRDPLYAAIDLARGVQMLVLECKGNVSGAVHTALGATEGYAAKCMPLDISTIPKLCILIESTPDTPFDVFLSLCEDVAQAVLLRTENEKAENVFAGRLLLWKRLFENRGTDALGYETRLGLLAEIIHLHSLLAAGADPVESVTWWTGPDSFATDFQSSHARIEVKATTSRRQYKVRIHGERQLEVPEDRPLSLVAMMFEKVVGDGVSLPDEVLGVRQMLGTGVALQMFNAKLLEMGYLAVHEDSYRVDTLRLLETREYQVAKDFPRIRKEDVPEGVGDLQFSIDLSACEGYRKNSGYSIRCLMGSKHA